jgi:hypothetical protein
MMKKNRSQPEALETIDVASLHDVTGGRISNSGGPDPAVARGMKSLAETVSAVGQGIAQAKQKKEAEMGQIMQMVMQRRQGG